MGDYVLTAVIYCLVLNCLLPAVCILPSRCSGDLGITETVPPLLECLASEDMMTRQRLAHALGCFPSATLEPSVVDALQTLASDPSFAVREAAMDSLARYGIPVSDSVGGDGQNLSAEEQIEREVAAILSGDLELRELEAKRQMKEKARSAERRRLERSFAKDSVTEFENDDQNQAGPDDSKGE